jgi:hypothetical protein
MTEVDDQVTCNSEAGYKGLLMLDDRSMFGVTNTPFRRLIARRHKCRLSSFVEREWSSWVDGRWPIRRPGQWADNHVGAVLVTRPPGIVGIVADRDLPANEDKLARSLGLAPETASESLRAVLKVIAESVSAGQIAEVRGQLPEEMKALFPATV